MNHLQYLKPLWPSKNHNSKPVKTLTITQAIPYKHITTPALKGRYLSHIGTANLLPSPEKSPYPTDKRIPSKKTKLTFSISHSIHLSPERASFHTDGRIPSIIYTY